MAKKRITIDNVSDEIKQLTKIAGRPIRLNIQTLKVKPGKKYAELIWIGDIHLGSPQCKVARLQQMLKYCVEKGIYIMLMGDIIELSTRYSIGAGVYEQQYPGEVQMEIAIDILSEAAKKGLIIGSLQGNHEERVYNTSGINIMKIMCNRLDIPYLHNACWNVLRVGNQAYSVYTLHGRTGARFEGTALLALERISASFHADIVAMGHCHKLISSPILVQTVKENRQVIEHKKLLVITGSYLSYDRSYAQTSGMPLSKLGSPKTKLSAIHHDAFISY